ncbi:MAG: response regulator [Chloroflexota bacterium]
MADPIRILLVDDIAEVRENVAKLIRFEQDFEVVGSSGSGRDGIKLAKELEPDIIIMDINMPDIDGISATQEITRALPAVGVIMMSVNSDRDYLRRAMMAGAKDFLTKPAKMDDLYGTIRHVYKIQEGPRRQAQAIKNGAYAPIQDTTEKGDGERDGHIVACFSPKGGVGTTTIAINLASSLMSPDTKVLLVDADIQFGDIGVFLNLQAQSTLADIIENANDLDVEYFENIVVTHPSGVKVLLGPPRPEFAEQVYSTPGNVIEILNQVRYSYDFIIIDTASRLDELTVSICDMATSILLVSTPTLPSIRNVRNALDLFDQLYETDADKVKLVLSQVHDERRGQRVTISQEKIESFLKRPTYASIPSEERAVLQAIVKGIPVIAADRNTDRPPVRELLELGRRVHVDLTGDVIVDEAEDEKGAGGLGNLMNRFGGR